MSTQSTKVAGVEPYTAATPIVHNRAMCQARGESWRIVTPPQQWAYAVEFRLAEGTVAWENDLKLRLHVRVHEGEIGVGLLTPEGDRFQEEVRLASNGEIELVELQLRGGVVPGPLMVRNTSVKGRSTADVCIAGYEAGIIANEPAKPDQEISINPEIFAPFKAWSGIVPSGYFADWTGVLTRADVWAFTDAHLAVYNRDRHEDKTVPIEGNFVLDWTPLAQAVKEASRTFRMAALGAGWGRWLAGGAALAAQTGRDYRLLGVEAEPQHFEWMLRHFRENNIPDNRYIALNAAAAGIPGDCLFAVGNSQAWYGQSIISEDQALRENANVRRTRGVTMDEILNLLSPLDYMQLDIQGAELDVLSYRAERMDREVRLINIGTHSAEIEAGLRKLFRRLGWECLYDVKLGSTHTIRLGTRVAPDIQFGDGVQVWRNPRFANG